MKSFRDYTIKSMLQSPLVTVMSRYVQCDEVWAEKDQPIKCAYLRGVNSL